MRPPRERVAEAARLIVKTQFGSTNTLMRRLRISFSEAGEVMDLLQAAGIVGAPHSAGNGMRKVLWPASEADEAAEEAAWYRDQLDD